VQVKIKDFEMNANQHYEKYVYS